MNAIILSIGDELVLGQTIDTNSAWLSQQLAAVGCEILEHKTVADNQGQIETAIKRAIGYCDFLIVSGGIGPTEDDLTRQALAAVMKVELVLNDLWLEKLVEFFKARGRSMPPINKIQAMIPNGAKIVENSAGTAAGIDATIKWSRIMLPAYFNAQVGDEYMERMFGKEDLYGRFPSIFEGDAGEKLRGLIGRKQPSRVFVVPGVPKEMEAMFTSHILPIISQATGGAVILSCTLHTFGLGESAIAEKLGDLMNRTRNPSVGTTVANGLVSLRINARFPTKEEAQKELDQTTTACQTALGDLIFGQDEETLPQIVAAQLRAGDRPQTVSTAESCTGGLVAKMLTDIPGSSSYFTQGWITYSNQSKYERLGVSMEIINVYGAVSEPVVESMAKNARRLAKSTFAISISGIAGPGGGSATKPVGTVCIALASPLPPGEGWGEGHISKAQEFADSQIIKRTFLFPGDRETIRDRAAKTALTMLRFKLLGKPVPF